MCFYLIGVSKIVLNPVHALWAAVWVVFQVGLHSKACNLTVFHFVWLPLLKDHCHTLANFEIRIFLKSRWWFFSVYHPCFPKDLCGNKIPLLTRFILLPNYIGDAAQSAAQVMSRFIITNAAGGRRGLAIAWQTEHVHTNTLATNQQWPGKL